MLYVQLSPVFSLRLPLVIKVSWLIVVTKYLYFLKGMYWVSQQVLDVDLAKRNLRITKDKRQKNREMLFTF